MSNSLAPTEYNGTPMRDIIDERVPHAPTGNDKFFVYIMGPYTAFDGKKAFDLDDEGDSETNIGDGDKCGEDDEDCDTCEERRFIEDPLFNPEEHHDEESEIATYQAALIDLCESIRERCGVRAFLATDVKIPTPSRADDLDDPGMTPLAQSLGYAAVSDAVIFIFSQAALNAGVGTEMGAVLSEFNLRGDTPGLPMKPRSRIRIFHTPYFGSATVTDIFEDFAVSQLEFSTISQIIGQIEQFIIGVDQEAKIGFSPVWKDGDYIIESQ